MRNPYALFVATIATIVNGKYPEHYSSRLQRELRLTLGGGTAIFALVAYFLVNPIVTRDLRTATTPLDYLLAAFTLLVFAGVFILADSRRKSIEQHVLQTSYEQVKSDTTSLETTQDALTLYDYFKVFFVLAITFITPDILLFIRPESSIIADARIIVFPLKMYYFFLVVNAGAILGGRWAKEFINNDINTPDKTSN